MKDFFGDEIRPCANTLDHCAKLIRDRHRIDLLERSREKFFARHPELFPDTVGYLTQDDCDMDEAACLLARGT